MKIHLCVHATMLNRKNKGENKIYTLKELIIKKQWWAMKILILQIIMIKIIMETYWNRALCLAKHIIQAKIIYHIQNTGLLPHPINIHTIPINFKISQAINRAHLVQIMDIQLMTIKHINGMLRICLQKFKINIITILNIIQEKVS